MAKPAERGLFEARRRKEQVAFLVVKFLRLYLSFKEIAAEFHARSRDGTLSASGLFARVAALSQGLGFELKELAHTLFRNGQGEAPGAPGDRVELASMKTTLERRFLDSSIGTGFHLLQILQEALYQVERYTPQLDLEKTEIERVMELSRESGLPKPAAARGGPRGRAREDAADLDSLHLLDEISEKLATDAAELAQVVIRRCEDLLEATARVIRRFGVSASDNEILVLNLLRNRPLVEQVYGIGSAEAILSELCTGKGFRGRTGLERALAFVKARCGNVSGLEPAAAS